MFHQFHFKKWKTQQAEVGGGNPGGGCGLGLSLVYYSDMYYVDKDYTKTIEVIPSPIWAYKSL